MTKLSIFLAAISIALITACANEDKTIDEAVVQTEGASANITDTLSTSTPIIGAPGEAVPAAQPTTTADGLNPAHGMPGHRCEIAVGAPLSSAPAAAAPVTINTETPTDQNQIQGATTVQAPPPSTPVQAPTSIMNSTSGSVPVSAAPVTTAPGMNPPHGQPGHDCAIAVGAPLKK
ncbi:MAG: hypothetical protein IPP71_02815 [Bacteroidetes bacterium]|nr:hypothetical protein [Bacteroidota bacterium]